MRVGSGTGGNGSPRDRGRPVQLRQVIINLVMNGMEAMQLVTDRRLILLIGIARKNGIMLVDFALHAEQNEGLSTEEAIYQACIKRFRPILMTTMAALLGAVPMMVGTGVGSEIRQPLGHAIVDGLPISQILTLYTTPVVYIHLDELQTWLLGERKQAASGHAEVMPAE